MKILYIFIIIFCGLEKFASENKRFWVIHSPLSIVDSANNTLVLNPNIEKKPTILVTIPEKNSKSALAVKILFQDGKIKADPKIYYISEVWLKKGAYQTDVNGLKLSQITSEFDEKINHSTIICTENTNLEEKKPLDHNISELPGKLPLANSQVFSKRCSKFIDANGKIGEWGKKVLDAIDKSNLNKPPPCFFEKPAVSNLCKNFDNFDENIKKKFWVYVFASISQDESSCRKNIKAPGVNGIADGLMQLEHSKSLRKRSARDPQLCKTNKTVNTQDLSFQFECASSILRDIYCHKERDITYRGGYWQELRSPNGKISNLIKKFPGCL